MEEIELKGLDEKIYVHETKEGLKVYMWTTKNVGSMYMGLSVKYGSIHTKFKVGAKNYEVPNGTAHFLEHVKFNISDDLTAHDEFYKLGGDANAFTTFNYTSYIVYATQNKQENLKLLLDYVYNPYFTKKLINKEKGIINEEANMTLDDPYMVSFFDSLSSTFQKSNYRNLITGTPDEVNSITLEDIQLVYNTWYHPKNMFLTLTGNFNPYEMVKIIDDTLSKKEFPKYQNPIIKTPKEPKNVLTKYQEKQINITYPKVKYNVKIPLQEFSNLSNLEIKTIMNLIMSINFGSTSDLKEDLMEKELITSMTYNIDIYDYYLIISITTTTNYPKVVIDSIKETLNNMNISKIDLTRKKNASIATLILDYEDIENVSMKLQDEIINYGNIIDNYKEILERITQDDLTNIINTINFDNASINVYLPTEV